MPAAPAQPRRRPLSRRRKSLYSAIVFITFFGGLELIVRAVWTPPVRRPVVGERQFLSWLSDLATTDPLAGPLYRKDPDLLWSLVPGAEVATTINHRHPNGERQPIRITINEDGHRGRGRGQAEKSLRVLCLGDSNFFGYPLDDEHAFPRALERRLVELHPDRDFEVINAGVPGYTIVQGERLYEKSFRGQRFDVVLLSYLNNDAWPQPQTDAQLFDRQAGVFSAGARVLQQSRLFTFLGSLVGSEVDPKDYVARVPLDEFLARYRSMIAAMRAANSRVVIVDHCAHERYDNYSQSLESLAKSENVGYFRVAKRVGDQLRRPAELNRYSGLQDRVLQRWGPQALRDRPYLLMYAEYNGPEHLNEVGVAWLVDTIAPSLFGHPK